MTHQITPVRTLVGIWAILLALALTTVLVSFVNLGPFSFIAAIGIAVLKAALVAWFFMNVRHTKGLTRIFVIAGLVWLGIMLSFTLTDYLTRSLIPEPRPW